MRWCVLAAAAATVGICSAGAGVDGGAASSVSEQASRPLLGSDLNGTIFSVQPGGADLVRLFPCGLGSPSLAPDGQSYLAHGIEPRARLTYGRIFRLPISDSVPTRCETAHNERLPSADTGLRGWSPRFSPNGRRLLFIDSRSSRVTTAAVNGSGKRAVGPRGVVAASWSPDGQMIAIAKAAFHRDCPTSPPSGNSFCHTGEVLVMKANGSGVRSLHRLPRYKPFRQYIGVRTVDWSRAGKILFTIQSGTRGASQLALVNADGTGFRSVTKWSDQAMNGVWSPTGRQVAYSRRAGGGVFLTTPTGRPISNVTTTWATNGLDW